MSGSSVDTTKEVFNISTPAGAVALLRRVHVSALPVEVKNNLRDAVFALQNSSLTTDREAAQELFKAHGIEIEISDGNDTQDNQESAEQPTVTSQSIKEPKAAFGRPAPKFSAPQSVPISTSEETVENSKKTNSANSVKTPIETAAVLASDGAERVPIKKEVDETQPDLPTTNKQETDPVERIKEIKRTINGLVGNPVNLIDVDNEVGREYMNSLLDAMKKVNTGVTASDMERAMSRLEDAFTAAQSALNKQSETATTTTEEANTQPAEPIVEENVDEVPVPPTSPDEHAAAENQVEEKPAPESMPDDLPVSSASPAPSNAAANNLPETTEPEAEAPIPEEAKATTSKSPVESGSTTAAPATPVGESMSSVGESAPVGQTDSQTRPAPATPNQAPAAVSDQAEESSRFTAVAKEKQLKQLMQEQDEVFQQQKTEQEIKDAANPLMAPEVTTGLEQLLSEWKLFKSSGIFGTGPSGIDHPLYKKLAPLKMAIIMTGRFEEASSEVKQTITEYMSGWRYEEGIVYDPGETFEHYLRRVIRHILDERKEKNEKKVDNKA